ncbi:hypothetical protein T265_12255 [Opisthorchis viverrini]|uniref:Uncharacterized protein n=1 Tax=Opisthorchis viverrini TaxID=6198 RepID=A0A074YZ57_OPIVI|nr:hypothetical protein T265_12255 [Opisthorchis viverrini]KER18497.1 hypothetical protein T265_12255 [Opisthorchis viverrini]
MFGPVGCEQAIVTCDCFILRQSQRLDSISRISSNMGELEPQNYTKRHEECPDLHSLFPSSVLYRGAVSCYVCHTEPHRWKPNAVCIKQRVEQSHVKE